MTRLPRGSPPRAVSRDPRRGTAIRDLSHKEVGPVLTLTPTAAEFVRTLVDQSSSFDSGGLRIAASEDGVEGVALELSLVGEPEALDETIEQSGQTVYLHRAARQRP